jgi:hypothetical protein
MKTSSFENSIEFFGHRMFLSIGHPFLSRQIHEEGEFKKTQWFT